jgi:integrase
VAAVERRERLDYGAERKVRVGSWLEVRNRQAIWRLKQAEERLAIGPVYDDHDLVCPRPGGSPWPPDMLSTSFASLVRRSGMKECRFHDLRHSNATQLLKAGVHPKVVSERLGHSRVGITLDTYSHVLPGMQEDAAQRIDAALRRAISTQT